MLGKNEVYHVILIIDAHAHAFRINLEKLDPILFVAMEFIVSHPLVTDVRWAPRIRPCATAPTIEHILDSIVFQTGFADDEKPIDAVNSIEYGIWEGPFDAVLISELKPKH